MKKCVTCLQVKPESEFNWRYKSLGVRQKSCRDCQHGHQARFYKNHLEEEKERTQRRRNKARQEAREYVYQYLLEHPCIDCGENDPRVLEFDHVRGKGKDIARLVLDGASVERIKVEIALTVVRCSNCHRKKTIKERNWFRGKK